MLVLVANCEPVGSRLAKLLDDPLRRRVLNQAAVQELPVSADYAWAAWFSEDPQHSKPAG
jgi:hypothetical protein